MKKQWFANNKILMTLSAAVFIGGYFFLRLAYHVTDKMPFTQEIILIVLGTVATILITAMLLNKQTSVELEKEQSVKFIELKTETYQHLIDTIETVVQEEEVSRNILVKLRFHTHRLAIFASPSVLEEYQKFLRTLSDGVEDRHVGNQDAEAISAALARLTVCIRADLVGELDTESDHSAHEIKKQILANAQEMRV